jgi:hypothetical protein
LELNIVITPQDFVTRWQDSQLREQQAAQSHFNELCELVGFKTPAQLDPKGEFFTFEENVTKATGGKGRADVWYRGHFAWEYKGKHKDLEEAYAQLLAYKDALGNPPLLVVSDFLEYRIYPQWVNTSGLPFKFTNQDLLNAETRRFIVWLLGSPEKFLELRQTELERREQITLDLAYQFAHLADLMRQHKDETGKPVWEALQIARFLTRMVFALFAEDVELLPHIGTQPILRFIFERAIDMPKAFQREIRDLFEAMDGEREDYLMQYVPYFNGGIFAESKPGANDRYEVLDLAEIPQAFEVLLKVSKADWRFVNPTIFGTLFEGALDVSKRAQLGAHYTSEADIRLVLEPVLMQPLYRQWEQIQLEAQPHLQVYLNPSSPKERQNAHEQLLALREKIQQAIVNTTVLDPACGSGNFLYMSLRFLKDLEGKVRHFFEFLGLPFSDLVTPRQLYGIEKDEFAANLAKVVVWIGYLQWRYEDSGILHAYNPNKIRNFPDALPHPVIKDKNHPDEAERIICADAIMRYEADGKPFEPNWQSVDVIVGNPPFLGGQRMQLELGDDYANSIRSLYGDVLHSSSDLVTYWFEKARRQLEQGKVKRVGLLATQAIRMGLSRPVLDKIKTTGDIFMAWSDREWILEGAAVRISIVGFDNGSEPEKILDGMTVSSINTDLTGGIDVTKAKTLRENRELIVRGIETGGPFELDKATAKKFTANPLYAPVIVPIVNGKDVTDRPRNVSVIDFEQTPEIDPKTYTEVYEHLDSNWKKILGSKSKRKPKYRTKWWAFRRLGTKLRRMINGHTRFMVTPRVAKHRLFVWLTPPIVPDSRLFAIMREDDYFFGVLHSKIHEIWSLRQAARHGDGKDGGRPTYNSTCFETFPFPFVPGQEDKNNAAYQAISAVAKQLHQERQNWLDGVDLKELGATPNNGMMKERTLTNLYNALNVYRGVETISVPASAKSFAPRLAELHDALDKAVCDAYGFPHSVLDSEDEILRHLLALNLERSQPLSQTAADSKNAAPTEDEEIE